MENKKILKYSEADMLQALGAVTSGMAVSTASRTYKVPRTTLLYKHAGKYPIKRKMGPDTVLSNEEEQALVRWMLHIAKAGFPATKDQLLDHSRSVTKLQQYLRNGCDLGSPFPGNTKIQIFRSIRM
ncbi:hypothetical protein Zmor_026582 [Zophobas morio]|uniref:HTH psq-type domain-containing protein n=1 Tax=Zophobas morio TaxID=2755281 RepID=A0AA38HTZ0_9CUCU|nr:hypothetical protein Zmor_026582 [Zophobas morio]